MIRTISILSLAFGLIMLTCGIFCADSTLASIDRYFAGAPTDQAIWFILSGAAALMLGFSISFNPSPTQARTPRRGFPA